MRSDWVLLSQGMTRPGIVSPPHWGRPFPRAVEPDPYRVRPEWIDTHMQFSAAAPTRYIDVRTHDSAGPEWVPVLSPPRRPNLRLSNPEMR